MIWPQMHNPYHHLYVDHLNLHLLHLSLYTWFIYKYRHGEVELGLAFILNIGRGLCMPIWTCWDSSLEAFY